MYIDLMNTSNEVLNLADYLTMTSLLRNSRNKDIIIIITYYLYKT